MNEEKSFLDANYISGPNTIESMLKELKTNLNNYENTLRTIEKHDIFNNKKENNKYIYFYRIA